MPQASLHSESQIHALQVNTPLLQRSPSGGDFTLKIGVKKSADLVRFENFPIDPQQVTIDAEGKIHFQFNSNSSAAFYRVVAE